MYVTNLPFTQLRENHWLTHIMSVLDFGQHNSRQIRFKPLSQSGNITNLLESSLTVLALISHPSVVTHAGPVDALP